jgi:DNA-binding NarL/FixJ family response regulator
MEVLIIDSSIQVSLRLKEILSELKFIKAIYTTNSHANASKIFFQYQPGIILLGFNIPENDSLNLLAKITSSARKTAIIALFLDKNECIVEQCRLLGADYFLDKYEDFEKIPGIITGLKAKTIN